MDLKFNWKIFNVFVLMSILILLNFTTNVSADATDIFPCCVPDYFINNPQDPEFFLEIPTNGECLNGRLVEECYTGSGDNKVFLDILDSTHTAISYGCCCADNVLLDLDSPSQTKLVSYLGCTNNPYHKDFIEKTSFNYVCNPQSDCGADINTEDTSLLKFKISGNVENKPPIENLVGARVIIDSISNLDISSQNPDIVSKEVSNGEHTYIVIFNKHPTHYNETIYANTTCIGWSNSQTINISSDQLIEVTLECKDQIVDCVPDWEFEVDPQDTCFPFNNKFYKYVEVWDKNQCGFDDENKPASYVECNITYSSATCRKQTEDQLGLEENEVCDVATDTGKEIFKINNQTEPVNQLTCQDLGYGTLEGTDGIVGCTPYCTYDYTQCTSPCDDVCSGGIECSCPSCSGSPLCENSCLGILPSFLSNGKSFSFVYSEGAVNTDEDGTDDEEETNPEMFSVYEDGTSINPIKDIFNYYDFIKLNSESSHLLPGVKFQIGSKDVELNWEYELLSCEDKVSHIEVSMCEVDDEGVCENQNKHISSVRKDATNYIFENRLEAGETFCFDVCVRLLSGEKVCSFEDQYITGNDQMYPYGVCFEIPQDDFCLTTKDLGRSCANDALGNSYSVGCDLYPSHEGNLTNLFTNKEHCPGVCRETTFNSIFSTTTGAECVSAPNCTLCNGLFGFYALGLKNPVFELPDETKIKCFEDQHRFENGVSLKPDLENYGFCYIDQTQSIIPQFDTCKKVESCYDYKSEKTCQNDPCYRFTEGNENDCVWEELNSELGLGVCRTSVEDEQECKLCDVDSPIGYCTEELCGLYGDCYYRDVSEIQTGNYPGSLFDPLFPEAINSIPERMDNTCVAKRDMGCVLYDDKDDCINANGLNRNADVDINYLDETKPIGTLFNVNVTGGTNNLSSSDDLYGFGTCMWDEELNYCYKNSNGNDESLVDRDDYSDVKAKDDCKGIVPYLIKDCSIDNEPPVTTINWSEDVTPAGVPKYGANNIATLSITAEDNIWGSGNHELEEGGLPAGFINTFVTFIKYTSDCKTCLPNYNPDYQLDTTKSNVNDYCRKNCGNIYPDKLIQSISQDSFEDYEGYYLMRYFSEDRARNLEVIQDKKVWIDAHPPNVTLVDRREVSTPSGTTYLTDLELDFETDEDAICSLTLRIPDSDASFYGLGDIAAQKLTVEGTSSLLTAEYSNLQDGMYKLYVDCYDDYFNHFTEVYDIPIEGDKTIYGATPKNETYKDSDNVVMSLKTIYPSECRFYLHEGNFVDFVDMPGTFQAKESPAFEHSVLYGLIPIPGETRDATLHEITLTEALSQIRKPLENKSYTFYVGCNKTSGPNAGEIVQNDLLDSISFTFDQYPPTTKLYYLKGKTYVEYIPEKIEYFRSYRNFKLILDDSHQRMLTPFKAGAINFCLYKGTEDLEETYTLNEAKPLCGSDGFTKVYANFKPLTISYAENLCDECYLLYYSEDAGNSVEPVVHAVPTKIRNVEFDDPEIIVNGQVYGP